MNRFLVKQSTLKGEIAIPPSKSQTLRAILFGALGSGISIIHNYLPSKDTTHLIEACRHFGASLNVFEKKIEIHGLNGQLNGAEDVINAGNSGIILRFCSAIAALSNKPIVITGDYSIRHQRPMQPLLNALSEIGTKAVSTKGDGFAPLIIEGPMTSGKVTVLGEDSQFVSALLIASSFAAGPIEINVENPGEKPWVLLTLNWLDRLKIPYKNHDFKHYQTSGPCRYQGFEYVVPADLSTAAFPIAAALVTNSEITLKNIDIHDLQGDKELIFTFQKMGALIEIDEEKKIIHVKKGGKLIGITADINHYIDAITILAVVACFAEGKTHIKNAAVAKKKECNRIFAITKELKKMGANIEETEDGLVIEKSSLVGAKVDSHQDHRMCMSLAVAGLGSSHETEISRVECVDKTFPTFLKDFQALFANIELLA